MQRASVPGKGLQRVYRCLCLNPECVTKEKGWICCACSLKYPEGSVFLFLKEEGVKWVFYFFLKVRTCIWSIWSDNRKDLCLFWSNPESCSLPCGNPQSSLDVISSQECDNLKKHIWSLTRSYCWGFQRHVQNGFSYVFCALLFDVKTILSLILTSIKPILYYNYWNNT